MTTRTSDTHERHTDTNRLTQRRTTAVRGTHVDELLVPIHGGGSYNERMQRRRPPASAPPAAAAAAVAAPAVAEAPSAEATPLSIRLTRRSLLKAVSASVLLQDCGALLGDSRGSAVTNSLAVVVPRIDVFVSHSWAASRAQKFLALAIYFNRPRLARVGLAAFALCFAAEAASLPQQLPSLFPDLVFTSTADDPVRMHLLFTHLFLLLPLALLLIHGTPSGPGASYILR